MVAAAFSDPVLAAQATFRAVLDASARPGTVVALTQALSVPAPLAAGAGAIALTLCDHDTPVWLDAPLAAAPAVGEWLRFHTATRLTDNPAGAAFALVSDARALPPFETFNPGTLEYPDRSTTLVVQVESFDAGTPFVLAGPGIAGARAIRVASLPADIAARLAANRRLFPRGVDLLLVAGSAIMALPRTTRVEAGGG
ncbi:MAG TPA: phosphonate C-P lyase system protein PhnH [Xanthobacteraceae bacterium]|nr:phosphonate C-P lyase system protein PhnH [Xanthobacteraceae bacterium]